MIYWTLYPCLEQAVDRVEVAPIQAEQERCRQRQQQDELWGCAAVPRLLKCARVSLWKGFRPLPDDPVRNWSPPRMILMGSEGTPGRRLGELNQLNDGPVRLIKAYERRRSPARFRHDPWCEDKTYALLHFISGFVQDSPGVRRTRTHPSSVVCQRWQGASPPTAATPHILPSDDFDGLIKQQADTEKALPTHFQYGS